VRSLRQRRSAPVRRNPRGASSGRHRCTGQRVPGLGEVWFAEEVALRLDELLTGMLATELVAIRPYSEAAPTAA